MGTIFDDASPVSRTDYFEQHLDQTSGSSEDARRNRRLLYWAMASAGFTNYAYEWWHYDYGDQMWVVNQPSGSLVKKAVYGPASCPN